MAKIRGPTIGGPPRRRRRLVAGAAVSAALVTLLPTAALGEGATCVGQSCDATYLAVTTTGTANSSGGVAISGAGSANGGVAAASGLGWAAGGKVSASGTLGNASRDSMVTTNIVSPTTDVGIVDNTTYVYGGSGVDPFIGTYARAAMQAREWLGIATGVDELTQAQDEAVRTLVDQILLNNLQSATQPTINTVNSQVNWGYDTATAVVGSVPSCPPTQVCAASSYGDTWDRMNEQEQRVCRSEPYDCNRARDTQPDAFDWTQRRYGRNAHNDASDAFRHCMWSALMTKRANDGFAKRFGDAHEYGDKDQPSNESYMDRHNNSWGREAGRNGEGKSETWVANVCQSYQRNGTLYWLR